MFRGRKWDQSAGHHLYKHWKKFCCEAACSTFLDVLSLSVPTIANMEICYSTSIKFHSSGQYPYHSQKMESLEERDPAGRIIKEVYYDRWVEIW